MVTVIIPAAGQGRRMGSEENKVFLTLKGESVLGRTIRQFAANEMVTDFVLVAAAGEEGKVEEIAARAAGALPYRIVIGGAERQHSIANALAVTSQAARIILVHDGARPLVSNECITQVVAEAGRSGAAVTAVQVKDTIKRADEQGVVLETPERAQLWAVQTPQGFDAALLRKAYAQAAADGVIATDDAGLVERLGHKVKLVRGNYQNIKITTPDDLQIAGALLEKSGKEGCAMRIGMGYDVHRLVVGRKLILGGEEIPYEKGLDGHSDADVLLHAIKDALLGAAGLGDIGRHFPDTDMQYKGASSLKLLARVGEILQENGYRVNNIDATVIAQKPKLANYIPAMNRNIARVLQIPPEAVNVKATTTEGLGFAGTGEGMAAQAIASIL